jgi:hypothetical protein
MSDLGKESLPSRVGVYLARTSGGGHPFETDVYSHPIKGLSCCPEGIGPSWGKIADDDTGCYVLIHNTGLEFVERVRDLGDIVK